MTKRSRMAEIYETRNVALQDCCLTRKARDKAALNIANALADAKQVMPHMVEEYRALRELHKSQHDLWRAADAEWRDEIERCDPPAGEAA